MSLPERIRVFILRGRASGQNHAVTFDAGEAVHLKTEFRARGVEIDLEERIATRGFQSTGEIEFRCFPCASHHQISVEAVDGPNEAHDGCCDAASAARERLVDALIDAGVPLLELCEHEFEDVGVEHEDDEIPVSMNAFTDAIRTETVRSEVADQLCTKCGATQVEVRPCKCEPEIPCRCPGPCRC